MTLLQNPPGQRKYTALKALLLLRRHSHSDTEKRNSSLSGLGDGTTFKLMENTLCLLGMDDIEFLFTHGYLRQLSASMRAGTHTDSPRGLWLSDSGWDHGTTFRRQSEDLRPKEMSPPVVCSRRDQEWLLFIEDSHSGGHFLVDSSSPPALGWF